MRLTVTEEADSKPSRFTISGVERDVSGGLVTTEVGTEVLDVC
jgi:hypothetical protein